MQKLLDEGIATRPGVMASHLEPPYRNYIPNSAFRSLKLPRPNHHPPLFPQMTEKEQEYVIDQLKNSQSDMKN